MAVMHPNTLQIISRFEVPSEKTGSERYQAHFFQDEQYAYVAPRIGDGGVIVECATGKILLEKPANGFFEMSHISQSQKKYVPAFWQENAPSRVIPFGKDEMLGTLQSEFGSEAYPYLLNLLAHAFEWGWIASAKDLNYFLRIWQSTQKLRKL